MGGTALDSKSIQLQALNSIFEKKKRQCFFSHEIFENGLDTVSAEICECQFVFQNQSLQLIPMKLKII